MGEDLDRVLDMYPELQDFGFGVFDRGGKTADQVRAEIDAGRDRMRTEESLIQFEASRRWLARFGKRAKVNRTGTSYGLKHVAEVRGLGYVTNGIFIAAALAEGFNIQRVAASPNVYFNIANDAWK